MVTPILYTPTVGYCDVRYYFTRRYLKNRSEVCVKNICISNTPSPALCFANKDLDGGDQKVSTPLGRTAVAYARPSKLGLDGAQQGSQWYVHGTTYEGT